jgi:hypothetical protein
VIEGVAGFTRVDAFVAPEAFQAAAAGTCVSARITAAVVRAAIGLVAPVGLNLVGPVREIGRASCRERV